MGSGISTSVLVLLHITRWGMGIWAKKGRREVGEGNDAP